MSDRAALIAMVLFAGVPMFLSIAMLSRPHFAKLVDWIAAKLEPLFISQERLMARRSIILSPYLSTASADAVLDQVWREALADTDALIRRIDSEVNALELDRLVTSDGKRDANVCAWGRYHDPEYQRCECWDPGQ